MRDLNHNLAQLTQTHRAASHSTQDVRSRALNQMANELHELGFRRIPKAANLKPKHVHALVSHWQQSGIKTATIKNRMSHLRWVQKITHNPGLVRRTNEEYGIGTRVYSTNEDRSLDFEDRKLASIQNEHIRMSAELQREFGLRREEAMKFTPVTADQGDHIKLEGSWCKGGFDRTVPVRNDAQRDVLDRARALAGNGSLIPSTRSYIQQVKLFEYHMTAAGLSRSHGARHMYAQDRYKELTGRECPARGGRTSAELNKEEKENDREARMTVSAELGHGREQVTVVYLGR